MPSCSINTRASLARGGSHAAALSIATGGRLDRSRRWREQLSSHDETDELRIVLADRTGCWGYVDLFTFGARRYDEEQVQLARTAARLLTPALRRAARPSGRAASTSEVRDPAVLIVGDGLRVGAQTGAAARWLAQLRHGTGQPLPCAVLAVTARAMAAPADDAVVREQCVDGRWATVRGARLDTGGVAVTIEHAAPREVLDYLARAVALTRREREVLALLFRGEDTRSVADCLAIEPGTVQDHVKSILAKTGYPTRRELLASVVTSS